MKRHLENVFAHAAKELTFEGKEKPRNLLQRYQRFVKIEEHRVRLRHYAGGGGREVAGLRVSIVDAVLQCMFTSATQWAQARASTQSLALVAIGGYGRGELNPFSDVDIMFLYSGKGVKPGPRENEIIEQILYLLWDLGFKVGHSTRSIKGATAQANEDPLSKTSMLEARFVTGDKELFEDFLTAFDLKCVKGSESAYLQWRVQNQMERHKKFENTVFLQEPNVKSGCGGLRDYQNLLWMTYFKAGIPTTANLVERKYLSESERRSLEKAYDFLLRIRTELHYQSKRGSDVLTLYLQGQIATKLEYPQRNVIKRSEAFMREYYSHARNIFLITASVSERLSIINKPTLPGGRIFNFLARRQPKKETFDGFVSTEGLLRAEHRDVFKQDPMRLMRAFLHAQQRQLGFSADLQQLIRARSKVITRTFQYSKAARETFEAILSRKGEVGRVLRLMHESDVLGRYIPEFGELTCLVQHEFFHRYTADEHTLVCVEKLDMLIDTTDPKLSGYRKLFQDLEDPYTLYLAILLHDTGKASGARDHAEASALYAHKVARRLQLSPERRRHLIFLVDQHMLLSETAQRRNLDDEITIKEFAALVGTQQNLEALMLLTLADGLGVGGTAVWSDWKEALVWQLFRACEGYLKEGAAFYQQRRAERDALRKEVGKKLGASYAEEVAVHFDSMPASYFRRFDREAIVSHLKLFRTFMRNLLKQEVELSLVPATTWFAQKSQGHSEVHVITWDRDGLLARIAGAFAVARLNILSADIYTRSDNLVLDVFRVCDTNFQAVDDQSDIATFEKTLRESMLNPEFDLSEQLGKARARSAFHLAGQLDFPTRISIRNDVHPVFTLIDIQTPDRLGLLYELLSALTRARINIALSRIATEKGAAIDTFYVTDMEGRKVTRQESIKQLQKILQQAAGAFAAERKGL